MIGRIRGELHESALSSDPVRRDCDQSQCTLFIRNEFRSDEMSDMNARKGLICKRDSIVTDMSVTFTYTGWRKTRLIVTTVSQILYKVV